MASKTTCGMEISGSRRSIKKARGAMPRAKAIGTPMPNRTSR
jgi:hypothetical protein